MTFKILKIFPTILYENNIGLDEEDKKNLKEQEYVPIFQNDIKNGYISYDKYVLNKNIFKNLKKNILVNVENYMYNILNVKKDINFYITNSWCMKHNKNDKADSHFHDNCIISGVYYFETPKNCGNLVLERNRHRNYLINPTIILDIKNYNDYNSDFFYVEVTEGKLILFPSHQIHSTEKNTSDKNRYCLAFNVFFEGKVGESDLMNELNIKNNYE